MDKTCVTLSLRRHGNTRLGVESILLGVLQVELAALFVCVHCSAACLPLLQRRGSPGYAALDLELFVLSLFLASIALARNDLWTLVSIFEACKELGANSGVGHTLLASGAEVGFDFRPCKRGFVIGAHLGILHDAFNATPRAAIVAIVPSVKLCDPMDLSVIQLMFGHSALQSTNCEIVRAVRVERIPKPDTR